MGGEIVGSDCGESKEWLEGALSSRRGVYGVSKQQVYVE